MSLLAIGDGTKVGHYDVVGDGAGAYHVRRRDDLGTEGWKVIAYAGTPEAAFKGLELCMNQDAEFTQEWRTIQSRVKTVREQQLIALRIQGE